MLENNSDIVQMRANRVLGFIKRPYFSPISSQTITQPALFDKCYISFFGVNLLNVCMWGKLYRIETLRKANLSPSGFKMGEDLIFNLKLFPHCNIYTLIDYRSYNYRIGGLTSRYNPTLWRDLKRQYLIKRGEAEKHSYSKAYRPLAIELKNILITECTQRIFYLYESDEDLIKWIESEIRDNLYWLNLKDVLKDSDEPAAHLIVERNAEGVLNEVKKKMINNRKRQFVKRVLMKLMK